MHPRIQNNKKSAQGPFYAVWHYFDPFTIFLRYGMIHHGWF